jgi:hypothetical protein
VREPSATNGGLNVTAKEWVPLKCCTVLTAIVITPVVGSDVPGPLTHPWVPFVSKSQLPQLGFPPVPGQLKVDPRHALLQPVPPQAAVALAWVQSVQVVDVTAQWVVSLFAEQEVPQRCAPALQPVTHVPVLQLAVPVGKLQSTPHPPQLLFESVDVSQPSVSLVAAVQLAEPGLQAEVPVAMVQPPELLQVTPPDLTLASSVQL